MWSSLVWEHSSYLINVNFLPLPFKSSIVLMGMEAVTADGKLRSCAFPWNLTQCTARPDHRPLSAHLLNSALIDPNRLWFWISFLFSLHDLLKIWALSRVPQSLFLCFFLWPSWFGSSLVIQAELWSRRPSSKACSPWNLNFLSHLPWHVS